LLIEIFDWNEAHAFQYATLELSTALWYQFEAKSSFHFISFSYLGCQGYEWIDFDIKTTSSLIGFTLLRLLATSTVASR